MPRRIVTIVLATTNPGKLKELEQALSSERMPMGVRLQLFSLASPEIADARRAMGADALEVPERGQTYLANATTKAMVWGGLLLGLPVQTDSGPGKVDLVVADDSGLDVFALPEVLGVQSATWHPGTDEDRVQELLRRLKDKPDREPGGQYVCQLMVTGSRRERGPQILQQLCVLGTCMVNLTREPRGEGGFGYDSVTVPIRGDGRTFAEMSLEEKFRRSHRGDALRHFVQALASWSTIIPVN